MNDPRNPSYYVCFWASSSPLPVPTSFMYGPLQKICFFRIAHYPEEWIGLRRGDADTEGFYWLDGTAVDHTNWQGGYPENATDAEDCVIDASEYYGDGWKASGLNYVLCCINNVRQCTR